MSEQDIRAFNRRASQDESLVGRSLFTAGVTWPGVMLWDDIRTLDYLASRPEVDAKRLGCVGLSVGGYRSYLLAALDERIKAAVDVGWMTSFGAQLKEHVINTMGLSFHINGLYRYLDFPDLAALVAPRALLVINGSQDGLFALDGVHGGVRRRSRSATPRRARPTACGAACTTRRTSSISRCRRKRGRGWGSGSRRKLPTSNSQLPKRAVRTTR